MTLVRPFGPSERTSARNDRGEVGTDDGKVGHDGTQEFLAEHPTLVSLGRVGWVAKGAVYGLVGVLAMAIALGWEQDGSGSSDEASQSGAIARIAEASFGGALLTIVAVGLLLYAIWRLVTVVLPAENTAKAWATRSGYAVSALVYLVLAWSAWSFVTGGGSSQASGGATEDSKVEGVTSDVLAHTGGRWFLGVVAIVVLAIGCYFVVKGARRDFDDQLKGGGVGPLSHRHIVLLGRVGWVGRGVMLSLVGFFLFRAVWRADPQEAQGLDGSLRQTLETTGGTAVVLFVGVALVVYGAYCIVSAPLRRLAPAED